MIRPRTRLLAAVLIVLIALSGCGGSSDASAKPKNVSSAKAKDISNLSGKTILAKAKAQFENESNVSMNGTTIESGTAIAFKLRYSARGAAGTVTIKGGVLTLLTVGSVTYFKADDAFWKNNVGNKSAAVIAFLRGRWIKATATDAKFGERTRAYLALADRAFVAKEFFTTEGPVLNHVTKKVDGVLCVGLIDNEGTSYIATANARPIEISSSSNGGGDATFSYGKVDIPKAPPAADVIDSAQLGSDA